MGPPEDIRLSFNEVAEIYDRVRPAIRRGPCRATSPDPATTSIRRYVDVLDAIESLILDDFGGVVTRPLVVTLTTASLV